MECSASDFTPQAIRAPQRDPRAQGPKSSVGAHRRTSVSVSLVGRQWRRGRLPDSSSTVLAPVARYFPSGLKSTDHTGAPWLIRVPFPSPVNRQMRAVLLRGRGQLFSIGLKTSARTVRA
jgi:hypothetical protein